MTETFAVSLMARSVEENGLTQRRRLKEISEHWNRSNRRGYGHYTKAPAPPLLTNLSDSLMAPVKDINDDLTVPDLSAPTWLNVTIGLLLSIRTIRQSAPRSTSMRTPLLIDVANFIESWCVRLQKSRSKHKKNAEQEKLLNTTFIIPANVPTDTFEQSIFLLRTVLLPIISKPILAIKTYNCSNCKYTISKYTFVDYIPVSLINGQLQLRHGIITYFSSVTSDLLCCRCTNPMDRHIELLDCK